ncbi:SPFH/Band 7/PHB domain protein [Candidatus Caldipriscus sp.]|jgi:regulator of protease activity HflC (stomatin/prohibitin superfamily)|nr:SPFH/Band 7/PHB domain protein [Candidatus Caldipriscus sp.]
MWILSVVIAIILLWLVVSFITSAIIIVRPYEAAIVERLGRYQKTLYQGLHFVIPFLDRVIKVDLRERVVDVPPQEVITRDNVVVTVDGIIYYRVIKPEDVVYRVQNFQLAAVALAQTNLRNIIGELTLDETLTSREIINAKLRTVLDEATDPWGVKITRVEIKRIDPPKDVMDAMHKQMKAEREKRAMILEAEGFRESQIKKAEGLKESQILEAEGKARSIQLVADAEKYSIIARAQGEAEAIRTVFGAIKEIQPTKEILLIQYFDALKKIADGQASKVFFPVELSSLASALGLIGENLKGKE